MHRTIRFFYGPMIFEDIKAFVAVAEQHSFSQAANYLCVAQSALSKRVQRLEARIGTPLLERHARGVTLSDYGHAFLPKARQLVEALEHLEKDLTSTDLSPAGEVTLALPQRTAGFVVPRVIARCAHAFPRIKIHVLEGTPSNVHGWTMRGEADIAITYSCDAINARNFQPILTEPLFLFLTTALARQYFAGIPDEIRISDLEKVDLILPRRPNPIRVLVDKLAVNHNLKVHIGFECDGTSALRGMLEHGMGATIFGLNSTWSYLVEKGELLALPFASPLVNWKMYLVRNRSDMDSLAINKVYQVVHEELAQLLAAGAWPHATTA